MLCILPPSPPAARTPILPPLRKVFAVIEEQREQDLELGEQPLPQLLAPVQLPVEIQPPQALNEVMPELSLAPPMLVNDPSLGREPMRISAGMRRDSITSRHSFGETICGHRERRLMALAFCSCLARAQTLSPEAWTFTCPYGLRGTRVLHTCVSSPQNQHTSTKIPFFHTDSSPVQAGRRWWPRCPLSWQT